MTSLDDARQAGNFLDAILDPIAADTALVPYDLLIGADQAPFATLGTVVNFAELFS